MKHTCDENVVITITVAVTIRKCPVIDGFRISLGAAMQCNTLPFISSNQLILFGQSMEQ